MSVDKVRTHLSKWNRDRDVVELEVSTATVELAAEALKVVAGRIAKSLSFRSGQSALLIVVAGDKRVDNRKFKQQFGFSPRMLNPEEVLAFTGFAVGGVCPFGLPDAFPVYLDESLRQFDSVFPACGSSNSMIEVSLAELEEYSGSQGWVEVSK